VLYEGKYAGNLGGEQRSLLRPGEHYLSLKWDHSNLDDVLEELGDPARRKEITDRAHQEVLRDPKLHFRAFVEELDDRLDAGLASLER
jgi:hypothetical protein